MKLRDYQQDAIDGLYSYFSDNTGNPLLVLPTGSGKSVIQAAFLKQALEAYPNQRFMLLTHVKELIEQNHEKLKTLWPEAPTGIYSASLNSRDMSSSIIYAGIQSVHKKALEFGRINLIIVDECHLIPNNGEGMYRKFIEGLKVCNPDLKIIGMTATPYRLKTGLLTDGDIFDDIAYELPIRKLLKDGYLSRVTTQATDCLIDLTGVKTRAGDFVKSDLEKAVNPLTETMLNEVMERGKQRNSWLFFCVSVAHAEEVRDALRQRGISAECVTGSTDKKEREQIINDYKTGKIKALTNCDVLTTGFDAPTTDLLVLLRPTKSVSLYIQIVGRGMRLSPETGKENCLVLDFAGNIQRHGPVDCIEVKSKKLSGKKGEVPTKVCPDCEAILSAFVKVCPECDHKFPEKDIHEAEASKFGITSDDIRPEWIDVKDVLYVLHEKMGKPPSMRVDYNTGLSFISEWVCFEHVGYPQVRAVKWWGQRSDMLCPPTTQLALDASERLLKPTRIQIRKKGKYTEILGYDFTRRNQQDDRQEVA